MELRPYQKEAVAKVLEEWDQGHKKTLLVLPTGSGKTIIMARVTKTLVDRGQRVLLLAHRDELLQQAADKIEMAEGSLTVLEKAQYTSLGSFIPVTVGSVQSFHQKRLDKFPADYFQTILIDEAHHSVSDSYQRILDHFSEANVLGVTATADRSDRKNLGKVFDSIAFEYTLPQAIRDGYLVPIKAQTIPLEIDISSVSVNSGDYASGEMGAALEPYLDQIANEMMHYCWNKKTVVFLPLVSTSKKFCALLNSRGFKAAEVNGNSTDRSGILTDFDNNKYNVLCNAMLLTEGWDCPSVDCVIVLRATKSRGLYCQMVGRGTRLSPGKTDLLLLDFLWHTATHDLCRPAYLIAKDKATADRMTEKINNNESPSDLTETQDEVERDIVKEREEKLAEELAALRKRKRRLVDPLQYQMSIMDADLIAYAPTFAWEMDQATAKQLQMLESSGIDPDTVQNRGYAAMLINKLQARRAAGLCTPKQIKLLEKYRFRNVGTWSFDQASSMISLISGNRWQLPYWIKPETYIPR